MMKRLLPQANSLSRVIDVFIYYGCRKDCHIQDIASFCKFERRQAQYYLNASVYLGLLDKDLQLTDLGNYMLKNSSDIKRLVYQQIISDEIAGKIFAHMLLYPQDDHKAYSVNFVHTLFPEYGEAVIRRRVGTLVSWCKEIMDYINDN